MELDKAWSWKSKKLACRIRPETIRGNPAGDDLRERFAELGGVDLRELLGEMKTMKKKREQANKLAVDHDEDKIFNNILNRSHVLNATEQAITKMRAYDEVHEASFTQKNLKKQFTLLPKSPPKRVLLEIQRERSKPLKLPDPDEQNLAAEKLEKRLAKQRAARMAVMDRSATDEDEFKSAGETTPAALNASVLHILPKYEGDKFGTGGPYLNSMLYLSRMANSFQKSNRGKISIESELTNDKDINSPSALNESFKKVEEDVHRPDSSNLTGTNESTNTSDVNSKLFCATALCNWSRNPANAQRLADEGAVRAISQLFLEPNARILKFCAAAFRYMSEHAPLALKMIDFENAIGTISDVIASCSDEFVCSNLAIVLVNLTRINGKEAHIVEAGIVLAFMNIILIRQELSATCIRGLYNLTCVDAAYPLIERVIRALVSLSSSGTVSVKHICAAAICNLSDLKVVRSKLVEEGAINILGLLSRGAETRTRRVCAVILQNLSASKSCRVDMTSRSSVTVAYGLSSDQDPVILRAIGLTISRLSLDPANSGRIIYESGITALCNIGVKYPTIPGISQPIAMAFQLLSSSASARMSIVQEGSITAIASLLRLSSDMLTLQHSLLCLCNLLIEPDSHLSIVQQGLLANLINLSGNENDMIKEFCALAFLNLSSVEDSRKHIVNSGAIKAIVTLANCGVVISQRRCAASLCNVSSFEQGIPVMVNDGIIPSLVSLILCNDIETIHFACVAFCRLCITEENGRLILESGAIPNLVKCALNGDVTTKKYCGSILSSLSFYNICRIPLCNSGIMPVFKMLATLNDEVTKQRCLVAYANLSCEPSVQKQLIDEGVVKIIAELAESYQEVNYICCAKAMCNLACNESLRIQVAKEGGVNALLMISMVHSVDEHTKLLCILAVLNLIDDSTIGYMLEEGIVSAVANLSKIIDIRIKHLCAKIFNRLTLYVEGCKKIVEKKTYLYALYGMLEGDNSDMKTIAALTTCNLVLSPVVQQMAIEAGAIKVLEQGVLLEDEGASLTCIRSLFAAALNSKFTPIMSAGSLPVTILKVSITSDGEKYCYCMKILAMIAWDKTSRASIQKPEFVSKFVEVISANFQEDYTIWIVTIMKYMAIGHSNPKELIDLGFANALWIIHLSIYDSDMKSCVEFIVEILRILSQDDSCLDCIANESTIAILNKAMGFVQGHAPSVYNMAIILYRCASSSAEKKILTAVPDTIKIMEFIIGESTTICSEPLSVTLCLYLYDNKTRSSFYNASIASIIYKILTSNTKSNDTLNNAVSAVYAMSKLPKCRDIICSLPYNIEIELQKLCQSQSSGNVEVKANCTRTLKNLSMDAVEAIEEGTVAALIAMSLEGKMKAKAAEDYHPYAIIPLRVEKLPPPECMTEVVADAQWFDTHNPITGGAAGKGPEPPEPPAIALVGSSEYPLMAEDIEIVESNDGKMKMAFAKMQIPVELKSSYILSDSDFESKQTQTEEDAASVSGAGEYSVDALEGLNRHSVDDTRPGSSGGGGKVGGSTSSPKSIMSKNSSFRSQSGKEQTKRSKDKGKTGSSPTAINEDGTDANGNAFSKVHSSNSNNRTKSKEIPVSEKAVQLGLYA